MPSYTFESFLGGYGTSTVIRVGIEPNAWRYLGEARTQRAEPRARSPSFAQLEIPGREALSSDAIQSPSLSHIYIPTASYYISRSLRSVTPRSATPRTLNQGHILNDPSILMCPRVLLSTRTAIVRRAPTNENTETQKRIYRSLISVTIHP